MGLTIQNVTKSFPTPEGTRVNALENVSIDVEANEFLVLLGPSGCGKTTLLRIIAGLENADSGELLLNGTRIDTVPPNLRRVNTVFQSYALFPHLNVEQNIAFGLEMEKQSKADIKRRVDEMLSLVELDGLGKRMPSQLSGGQQQRVALARALAKKPQLLLLDEPLSALDLKLRRQMQTELKRIQQSTGIGFIFVTHDQGEALALGDRIAVINRGQIAQLGTPREIYEEPTSRFVADFIGDTNLIAATLLDNGEILVADQMKLALKDIPGSDKVTIQGASSVYLVIHPERIKIDPAGPLRGVVTATSYYGTEVLIDVNVAVENVAVENMTGENVRCRVDALNAIPQIGETIGLQIESQHARLVIS